MPQAADLVEPFKNVATFASPVVAFLAVQTQRRANRWKEKIEDIEKTYSNRLAAKQDKIEDLQRQLHDTDDIKKDLALLHRQYYKLWRRLQSAGITDEDFPPELHEILQVINKIPQLSVGVKACKKAALWVDMHRENWVLSATENSQKQNPLLLNSNEKRERFRQDISRYLECLSTSLINRSDPLPTDFVSNQAIKNPFLYVAALRYIKEEYVLAEEILKNGLSTEAAEYLNDSLDFLIKSL